jgi:hypothetical protein
LLCNRKDRKKRINLINLRKKDKKNGDLRSINISRWRREDFKEFYKSRKENPLRKSRHLKLWKRYYKFNKP